jgi:hypothetical protein
MIGAAVGQLTHFLLTDEACGLFLVAFGDDCRLMQAVMRIMAKDLVRTRNHVKKMILMKSQIQTVALSIQGMKSTNTMATVRSRRFSIT